MNDTPSYKPRPNGKPILAPGAPENKEWPTIQVIFNPETQQVGVRFDNTEFKTWDFVIGLLEAGKQQAIQSGEMARAMAMQAQMQQQAAALQQGSQLAQKVNQNILRG